jgi:hypothetical protein
MQLFARISLLGLIPFAFAFVTPLSADQHAPTTQILPTTDTAKPKMVMCQWLAEGKTQFMCLEKPMKEAQKTCDEQASKSRGDTSKCACTDDENYIRDSCG